MKPATDSRGASLAIHDALWIIAARIKTIGRIPATVVGQIIVATIHYYDGVAAEPPIPAVGPDPEMNVSPITEASTQVELLAGLASISKNGRAA